MVTWSMTDYSTTPLSICLKVPSTSSQIALIFSFSWISSSSIWSILMFNLWMFISEFSACVSAAFNLKYVIKLLFLDYRHSFAISY